MLSKGGDLSKLNTTRILRLPHVHICPRGVLEFEYPGRLGRFDSGIPNVVRPGWLGLRLEYTSGTNMHVAATTKSLLCEGGAKNVLKVVT